MTTDRSNEYLQALLRELCALPAETEWVEFKHNKVDPDEMGEYISALNNSAVLYGKNSAYLVWGIDDESHNVIGTEFSPGTTKKGNEELESWLLRLLTPRIHFYYYTIETDGKRVVILEINRATNNPVRFQGVEYIRIGSYKKKLKVFSEKKRALWRLFDKISFERLIALERITDDEDVDIFNHDKAIFKTSSVSDGYFKPGEKKVIASIDIIRAKLNPKKGSIIISRMNSPALVGEVGYVENNCPNLYLPDRLWQTRYKNRNSVNGRWLSFIFSFPVISRQIKESATGTSGSMKNISKDRFLSIRISTSSFEEKNAIAKILSDMDKVTSDFEQRLKKTKKIKQGMIQELLTGKTRLVHEGKLNE